MELTKRICTALQRLRHRFGFGIHSPFMFDLLNDVIYQRYPYYAYEPLHKLHQSLSEFPRHSEAHDCCLFRLVNRFQPEVVVQVGTASGLSACYMAAARKDSAVTTYDSVKHADVEKILHKYNVRYVAEPQNIATVLMAHPRIDMLHIAHTSDYAAIFEEALSHVLPGSLFIIDDIHASKAKREWWRRVVTDVRTGITLDVRGMGLVFFDKSKPKQHYIA